MGFMGFSLSCLAVFECFLVVFSGSKIPGSPFQARFGQRIEVPIQLLCLLFF